MATWFQLEAKLRVLLRTQVEARPCYCINVSSKLNLGTLAVPRLRLLASTLQSTTTCRPQNQEKRPPNPSWAVQNICQGLLPPVMTGPLIAASIGQNSSKACYITLRNSRERTPVLRPLKHFFFTRCSPVLHGCAWPIAVCWPLTLPSVAG